MMMMMMMNIDDDDDDDYPVYSAFIHCSCVIVQKTEVQLIGLKWGLLCLCA